MALTDILAKIEKESDSKIEDLKKEFEKKKKALENECATRQKEIDERMHQRIEENSKKLLEKAETLAERESKNKLLKAKHEIIEQALLGAIDALAESSDYVKILTTMLKNSDMDDDTVVVPAKDKEEETKKAIKESGKKYFLSDKSTQIKGGFILKTAKVEVDNSFETLILSQMKEDLEINLHKSLF
ncbi:MAG: V-type ATP synthase subunit E [Candidatus Peregrinibacteria bacterium]